MKRSHIIITGITVLLLGAMVGLSATRRAETAHNQKPTATRYNICVLLDLSDRISPALQPLQMERDKRAINGILELFEEQTRKKLYVNSNDSLRVAVAEQPTGYGATLLKISDDMTIDMGELKITKKREQFPVLKEQFTNKVNELYQVAAANAAFAGADLWRFFREDLDKYRIVGTEQQPVRNVLLVLTDGYITFGDQKRRPREGKRASYMEVAKFRHNGWEQEFDDKDLGLISGGKHADWEVQVLEVNPHRTEDMPIISKYWSKWFEEMGIQHYRIEKTNDSARMSKQLVAAFLNEPTNKAQHSVAREGIK
jgi:hypothetical protein